MAQYTLTIKQLVENNVDIFNFDYPIFDESYRPILEQKIIDFYYFDEIGVETVGRFIHNLKTRLNVIMPFYNRMYESDRLKYDPLSNYDVTEIIKEIGNTKSTGSNKLTQSNETTGTNTTTQENETNGQNDTQTTENQNGTNRHLHSDTPQGRLSIDENYVSSIDEEENKNINTSSNRQTLSGTNNTTLTSDDVVSTNNTSQSNDSNNVDSDKNVTRTMKGNIGVQTSQELIMKYRQTFVRLDSDVIKELRDLFMLVY